MCRQNCLYGFPLIHCLAVAGGQGSMQKSQGKKKERQDLHPDVLIDGKLASPRGFEPLLTA